MLSWRELDKKVDATLMSVIICQNNAKYEAGGHLA